MLQLWSTVDQIKALWNCVFGNNIGVNIFFRLNEIHPLYKKIFLKRGL